jgi:glycine cleavage system aminomethyltransferase T
LLRIQEQGIEERWVGLHLDAKTPAVAGDAIYSIGDVATSKRKKKSGAEAEESTDAVTPGTQIGRVTSSAIGYSVGKTLALAYLRTSHAWNGSKVVVMMAGRPVTATVVATPFFDLTGARMRAKASDGSERVKK